MSEPKALYGTVKDGRVAFDTPPLVKKRLASLEGRRVVVHIQKQKSTRTVEQQKYFHSTVLKEIMVYAGDDHNSEDDKARVKLELLKQCFGTTKFPELGIEVINEPSTEKLDIEKYSKFIEWSIRWAAIELGVVVPDPNQVVE